MGQTTFRVATYNIRKAIGTDRRRSPERILDVLAELDADVVALQEADRRFGPRLAAHASQRHGGGVLAGEPQSLPRRAA